MKLSPEAKQTVKTAIEQLRLLLVDEDDAENLERLKKTFLYGAKAIIDEPDEKLSSKVVIEVPTLKFIGGNILEDIQVEIKQLKAQVEQLAIQTSCVLQAPVIRNAVIRNGSPV